MQKTLLALLTGLFTVLSSSAQERTTLAGAGPTEEPIFQVVEDMPEFPGGSAGMSQFLAGTLHYPQEARQAHVQGVVFVGFVVNRQGAVTDVMVLKGIGHGCDEEAARVVKLMPSWKPGRQKGKRVSVRYSLPIKFVLTD